MLKGRNAAVVFLLASLTSLFLGCDRDPRGRRVSLAPTPGTAVRTDGQARALPLRIAVAPVISPRENVGLYRPVLDYISTQLGRPVDFLQRRTYAEINKLIRHGHADVAFICTYPFVEGERDFGMQILAVPVVLGRQTYQSYIIVPKQSMARSITDLKGKSFAFSDPMSTSGYLFPTDVLQQAGETPETFFRRHVFTYAHDNTLKAVAQRLVDGGAMHSLVYEHMLAKDATYDDRVKIIQESSAWGNPPVVVHPQIDPTLRDRLEKIFLTMHESQQGRKVLAPLRIERFVPSVDSAYDPVRQMAAGIRAGLNEAAVSGVSADVTNKRDGQ